MNTDVMAKPAAAATKLGVIDCDIHPTPQSPTSLHPFLSRQWREHAATFGTFVPEPFLGHPMFVKSAPAIARRDAWPESGGPPGSDLSFMQKQHLDPMGIEHGMLIPMFPNPEAERNPGFAEALSTAVNEWQLAEFASRDARLHPSIIVPREDPEASVREIERCAANASFTQVMLRPHGLEPMGRKRYWRIFEAALAAGLPVGVHSGGYGAYPLTSAGWPSYYIEEHLSTTIGGPALATSLIMEGVFDRFPDLKVVFTEIGFAWVPSLGWRLDRLWERQRAEVPHVKRPPSEYLRTNCWFTTQPIEEPDNPAHLRQIFDWIGWDRLLFSSDYPHWDSDDPAYMFPFQISPAERRQIMRENALGVYGRLS